MAGKSPGAKARTRHVTAAKRSLNLIATMAQDQLKVIEDGGVPEGGFIASAVKLEQALASLALLAALAEGLTAEEPEEDDGTAVVTREDLALMLTVLKQAVPQAAAFAPGTPLARLLLAAGLITSAEVAPEPAPPADAGSPPMSSEDT